MPRPSKAGVRCLVNPGDCLDTSCWEWAGGKTSAGYGVTTVDRQRVYVHRAVTDAPVDMVVDHLCRNHACYNPRHLEIVTTYENMARGVNPSAVAMRSDYCQRGHLLSPQNVYVKPNGRRNCRLCRTLAARRYEASIA